MNISIISDLLKVSILTLSFFITFAVKISASEEVLEDSSVVEEPKEESVILNEVQKVKNEDKLQSTKKPNKRTPLGYVERLELYPEKLFFDAKLTPGSEGNVLHAEDIEIFKKNTKEWIRFKVTDRKGKSALIKRKLNGKSTFRTTSGEVKRRYSIKSGFCLDDKYMEVIFSLDDRSDFEQEVRIGRDALAGHFLIDPAKTKTTDPHCKIDFLEKNNKK